MKLHITSFRAKSLPGIYAAVLIFMYMGCNNSGDSGEINCSENTTFISEAVRGLSTVVLDNGNILVAYRTDNSAAAVVIIDTTGATVSGPSVIQVGDGSSC